MTAETLQPKLTYKPKHKLEVFYTGGAVRLSKDGKYAACACGDEVKVVDVGTGQVLRVFSGDTEPITALAISPNGKTMVAASRSLTIRVYNMLTGETLRTWKAHKAPVADMSIDPSGGYVATGSADREVRVWDLEGGFCTHRFLGHSGVVMRVMFHPKQMQLVSGGDDSQVRVWDLVDKSCAAQLKGHFSAVTSLALAPDGWRLLTGGRDKVVLLWDLRTFKQLATIPVYEALEGLVSLPPSSSFPGVSAASSKQPPVFFATAGDRGVLRIWRSDTAACVWEQAGGHPLASGGTAAAGSELLDVMVQAGGHQLVAVSGDARLVFLQAQQDAAGTRTVQQVRQLIGNIDEVTDLRFIGPPADPSHLLLASNSEALRLLSLPSLSCTATLAGHRQAVLALDTAPMPGTSSSIVVSGSKDNDVRVWAAPAGVCLGVGVGHVGAVGAVAVSRKGLKFAVSGGADKLLKVWDLSPLAASAAAAAAAGDEGKQLDSSAAGGVLQLSTLAAVAAHDKDINALAVAPNDQLAASASQDRTVRLWRLPDLVPAGVLRGHKRGVWGVQFSPVERSLLTCSADSTIRLWALADCSCLRTLEGHTASVLRACFVTAGTQVVSTGADGLVKLWGVSSGECINTFDEHEDKIWSLDCAGPSQALLATGGADAAVVVWEDSTAADAETAAAEEEELLLRQQMLQNALLDGDYKQAARLAFQLGHPGRLLKVLQSTHSLQGPAATKVLHGLVAQLDAEGLQRALQYCRQWNTVPRTCHAAQALLRAILRLHPPATLLSVPGAGDLLDGIAVYTGRHLGRLDRLLRSSFLLDYTLARMAVLEPDAAGDAGAAGDEGPSSEQVGEEREEPSARTQVGVGGEAAGPAEEGDDLEEGGTVRELPEAHGGHSSRAGGKGVAPGLQHAVGAGRQRPMVLENELEETGAGDREGGRGTADAAGASGLELPGWGDGFEELDGGVSPDDEGGLPGSRVLVKQGKRGGQRTGLDEVGGKRAAFAKKARTADGAAAGAGEAGQDELHAGVGKGSKRQEREGQDGGVGKPGTASAAKTTGAARLQTPLRLKANSNSSPAGVSTGKRLKRKTPGKGHGSAAP